MIQALNEFFNSSLSDFLLDWPFVPVLVVLLALGLFRWQGRLTPVRLQLALIAFPGVLIAIFFAIATFLYAGWSFIYFPFDFLMSSLFAPTNIICPLIFVYQLSIHSFRSEASQRMKTYSVLQIICAVLMLVLYALEQLLFPNLPPDD
jgi:hypothetical protein